jgi:hypothetical protein
MSRNQKNVPKVTVVRAGQQGNAGCKPAQMEPGLVYAPMKGEMAPQLVHEDTDMNNQERKAALKQLQPRRKEMRRQVTAVEQEILRTSRQVRVIQQQIGRLTKLQRRAA